MKSDNAPAFEITLAVVLAIAVLFFIIFILTPMTNSLNNSIAYQNSITTHLVERMKR